MNTTIVKDIVNQFQKKLHLKYPPEEIRAFMHITAEKVLQLKPLDITIKGNHQISQAQHKTFMEVLHKLEKNQPIQYIFGETEFYGLKIKVNENVLIPRQETELLVDAVIKQKVQHKNIIDLGTGSGCIAVALAKNLSITAVTAIDISAEALEIAQKNAMLNQVDIDFKHDDLLFGCPGVQTLFDAIVSNPPYVTPNQKNKMHANVLDYEPGLALFVSEDNPLQFYKAIINFSQTRLINSGLTMVEINELYGTETAKLFTENGFVDVEIIKDLNNKDRFVKARKNG